MIQQTVLPCKTIRTEKLLTPRGGLLPYAELIKALSVDDLVDKLLPKTKSCQGFKASQYVTPLMLTLYAGGSAIADMRIIALDEAGQEVLGMDKVPSQSACEPVALAKEKTPEVGV